MRDSIDATLTTEEQEILIAEIENGYFDQDINLDDQQEAI